ncbi:hypothetical protein GCM10027037_23280 [Mucilaginibacter koreensis]
MFSKHVKDSFYISVQVPLAYSKKPLQRYPVVVVTDANFFFPMLGPVLHQYEKGRLLPPLILVGVGYRSFEAMNASRVRDYLYPQAITSDEMQAVGGGQRFYHFITCELLPEIDAKYRTQQGHRTLMGHSFGGYFSAYALLEQLNTNRADFSNFISASPSLWYHNNYLFQLPKNISLGASTDSLSLYLSVGGLEDSTWTISPVRRLSAQLHSQTGSRLKTTMFTYPNLDHMDVGLIAFIKGLESIYQQ